VGELGSSVTLPPSTAKPLTVFPPESTTQSVVPSGESRASPGRAVGAFTGVVWRRVSEPSLAIEKLEIDFESVFTTNR
jgi:hypothetical protein